MGIPAAVLISSLRKSHRWDDSLESPKRFRRRSKSEKRGEVLGVGLEPTFLAEPDPKSGASANFATRAVLSIKGLGGFEYLLFAFVLQILLHPLPAVK